MKVYCKDCKKFIRSHNYCGRKTIRYDKITGVKYREYSALECEKENKNNSCKRYKRKWYKFDKPKNSGIADGKLSIVDQDNNSGNLSIV